MTFISPGFALFLFIVFLLYWLAFSKTVHAQNLLLLVASLLFYSWYNWQFSILLIVSILFNYYLGKIIADSSNRPQGKWFLGAGLLFNLGLLTWFKYAGFFKGLTSAVIAGHSPFHSSGITSIIIPLGISFYTFQLLGYLIDIYSEEIRPANDVLAFSTYIIYFPKIVAGPIEPAKKMLSQLYGKRAFDYAVAADGMRQILWGLFTKIVIANNCSSFTDYLFAGYHNYPGSTLLIGAFLYIFQVYCDFAGYSNIAIGISKLFGIQLSRNFHAPFFSTGINEYWRHWHMTLTGWMMKYVFRPVSFLLRGWRKAGMIVAVVITFIIVGFWHGPKWTFIVFGLLHGLYFIPVILSSRKVIPLESIYDKNTLSLKRGLKMAGLFLLVMFTCIFFGSNSVGEATGYIRKIFSHSLMSHPVLPPLTGMMKMLVTVFFIVLMLIIEWLQRDQSHELQLDRVRNAYVRRAIYFIIIVSIILVGSVNHIQTLYAQF